MMIMCLPDSTGGVVSFKNRHFNTRFQKMAGRHHATDSSADDCYTRGMPTHDDCNEFASKSLGGCIGKRDFL